MTIDRLFVFRGVMKMHIIATCPEVTIGNPVSAQPKIMDQQVALLSLLIWQDNRVILCKVASPCLIYCLD